MSDEDSMAKLEAEAHRKREKNNEVIDIEIKGD